MLMLMTNRFECGQSSCLFLFCRKENTFFNKIQEKNVDVDDKIGVSVVRLPVPPSDISSRSPSTLVDHFP